MSNPTKTRRMPVAYRVCPGGITEIHYSAIPQPIAPAPLPEVRLPGTRWLEARRAREQRLAAAAGTDEGAPGLLCLPEVEPAARSESWAVRITNAARRLTQRQTAWLSSVHGEQDLEFSPQD